MTAPRLETDRLILRQWTLEDRKPFAAMNSDPEVMEHFPSLLNEEESDKMADKLKRLMEEKGYGLWAVERKEDKKFIGFIGLHAPEAPFPFFVWS